MGEGAIEVIRARRSTTTWTCRARYEALDEAARRGEGVSAAAELLGLLL